MSTADHKEILDYIRGDVSSWKAIASDNSKDIAVVKTEMGHMSQTLKSMDTTMGAINKRIDDHMDKEDEDNGKQNKQIQALSSDMKSILKAHKEAMELLDRVKNGITILDFLSKGRNIIAILIVLLLTFGVGIPMLQAVMEFLGIPGSEALSFISYVSIFPSS